MTLTVKQKIAIALLVSTLGLIAITSFIVIPRILHIQKLNAQIYETGKQLELQQQQASLRRRSLERLENTLEFTNELSKTTIVRGEELSLIQIFEQLAITHNIDQTLEVTLIEPDKTTKPIKEKPTALDIAHLTSYYQFSFSNIGTFTDHVNFLKSLELLPYYVIIDTIHLSVDDKQTAEEYADVITLDFSADIFIRPLVQ
jgi:hypothetical protein